MQWKAVLLVVLIGLAAVSVLGAAPPARAATTDVSSELKFDEGGTQAFGGGSYRFIAFGTDAAFGVVWGNSTHANNVYLAAIKTRYLGVGQVYDASGNLVAANHVIKVYTVYAAQLQNIVEFKDGDGNGVANYSRTYDAANGTWTNYAFHGSDVGYKFVNLSAKWVAGNVTPTTGTGYRAWSFNLTAQNLSYYNITNKAKLGGALPLVEFAFHLNASLVQRDDVSIPQWNVTVTQAGGRQVVSAVVRMSDLVLQSAKTVHYDVKMDQLIQGWTYQPNNPVGSRRLLVEVGSIVANLVPSEVVTGWSIIHSLHDDGNATYSTDAGNETVDNSTSAYAYPRAFKSPSLDFGGAWTRIATFLWVSNSTVDGTNRTVVGQIAGGWFFATVSAKGLAYGFVLLTGLSYYGGNVIAHDPTVTSDSLGELVLLSGGGSTTTPTAFPWGAAILGVVLIVIVVLVAFVALTRREKKQEPPTGESPKNPPPR